MSADTKRLLAEIETFRAEIQCRAAASPGEWAVEARGLLDKAEKLAGDGEAWTPYQAAVRRSVDGLAPPAVWAEQRAVLAEAREKLRDWRKEVVVGLLGPEPPTRSDEDAFVVLAHAVGGDARAAAGIVAALLADHGDGMNAAVERILKEAGRPDHRELAGALTVLFRRRISDDRVTLQVAMLIRDEGLRNVHRRNNVLRDNIVSLALTAGVVAAAIVVLGLTLPIDLGGQIDGAPPRVWLYAFALGALGGAVSALQRVTARGTRGRLPELREQALATLALPLTGAAAGIATVPLTAAGIIPVQSGIPAALGVAFVAGFSERLIVRAAATVSGGRGGPSSSP